MQYHEMDNVDLDFFNAITKEAKKEMPHFTEQDRPEKVKEIYRALKRDHPNMPAEMKARIAAKQGKPGKQEQGGPYKAPIDTEYKKSDQEKDKKRMERTTKSEREKERVKEEKMEKEAFVADLWKGFKRLSKKMFGSKAVNKASNRVDGRTSEPTRVQRRRQAEPRGTQSFRTLNRLSGSWLSRACHSACRGLSSQTERRPQRSTCSPS